MMAISWYFSLSIKAVSNLIYKSYDFSQLDIVHLINLLPKLPFICKTLLYHSPYSFSNYCQVIFTNESNIERWKNKRQVAVDSKVGRLNNFIKTVKVPIQVAISECLLFSCGVIINDRPSELLYTYIRKKFSFPQQYSHVVKITLTWGRAYGLAVMLDFNSIWFKRLWILINDLLLKALNCNSIYAGFHCLWSK